MNVPTPFMEKVSDHVRNFDNICHALLTGILVCLLCFDWQRTHEFKPIRVAIISTMAIIGFLLTGIQEVCQLFTPAEYRRWFDPSDLLWQAIGGIVVAAIYYFAQHNWTKPKDTDQTPDFTDFSF